MATLEAWRTQALALFAHVNWPDWEACVSHPATRIIGLALLVYATIWAIAIVYSGDMQNSEMGPIGIRPHAAQKLDRKTILLPRMLMPMNMDGVSAKCRVFYAYTDPQGPPTAPAHSHAGTRSHRRVSGEVAACVDRDLWAGGA